MRSHGKVNKKELDVVSIIDLKQIAWTTGRNISESDITFNSAPTYSISSMPGLFTFVELKNLLLH
jgi:hypothetical protein